MKRRLDRKLVALAAAYAVALNILLPVVGAVLPLAASGAPGWAALCSASAPADRGAPGKPQPVRPVPLCPCCGAACAMPGCGATALPGGPAIGANLAPARVALAGPRQDGRQVAAVRPGGSKLARGPPIG